MCERGVEGLGVKDFGCRVWAGGGRGEWWGFERFFRGLVFEVWASWLWAFGLWILTSASGGLEIDKEQERSRSL